MTARRRRAPRRRRAITGHDPGWARPHQVFASGEKVSGLPARNPVPAASAVRLLINTDETSGRVLARRACFHALSACGLLGVKLSPVLRNATPRKRLASRSFAYAAASIAASTFARTLSNERSVQSKGCAHSFHSAMKARTRSCNSLRSAKLGAVRRFSL